MFTLPVFLMFAAKLLIKTHLNVIYVQHQLEPSMDETTLHHLLDFNQPFDIALLEQIVEIAYDSGHSSRSDASKLLVEMKDHPEMWKRANAILETSAQPAVKFFGLQVLEGAIDVKWKILPKDQREGIRTYVVEKITSLVTDDVTANATGMFMTKLNLILVKILKHDWPHDWPSFISDIVSASKTSECLCENNMKILQLLSEEVFDSSDSMTSVKTTRMKDSLSMELSQIFALCNFIFNASQKHSLIKATLVTLQRFISWIPTEYIFETMLLDTLCSKFLPVASLRVETIDCLIEVASLPARQIQRCHHISMKQMMVVFTTQLSVHIPKDTTLLANTYATGSFEECLFVQRVALFLSTFLRIHINLFLEPNRAIPEGAADGFVYNETAVEALAYLMCISEVGDEEIFKSCLDYWHFFAKEIYGHKCTMLRVPPTIIADDDDGDVDPTLLTDVRIYSSGDIPSQAQYNAVLLKLQNMMIDRMAKPKEVSVVENEDGHVVHETIEDTEVIAQHKTMREVLVYLTNLNCGETERILLEKLRAHAEGGTFSRNNVNAVCWTVGSISGAMPKNVEARLLTIVIEWLMQMCNVQRGNDDDAIVASNVMYVVGRYPRFLRAHDMFLETVTSKLFEFMHAQHEGVRNMACTTFIGIAQTCKATFMCKHRGVQTHEGNADKSFVMALIASIDEHIVGLQTHQVQSVYEALGAMMSAPRPRKVSREDAVQSLMNGNSVECICEEAVAVIMEGVAAPGTVDATETSRNEAMGALMEPLNRIWSVIIGDVANATSFSLEAIEELSRIIQINARVCVAADFTYTPQMSKIFADIMSLYRTCGEYVSQAHQHQGDGAVHQPMYKAVRATRVHILELLKASLSIIRDAAATFLHAMKTIVLNDYKTSPPATRDAEVITLFAACIATMKDDIAHEMPAIMEGIFDPTLELIAENMTDHPEHRAELFQFLQIANECCFHSLICVPPPHQKKIVDSIVWASKHTDRNISEKGLKTLLAMLQNIDVLDRSDPRAAQFFYSVFLLDVIKDLFEILTDRTHKSGFKAQTNVLRHIFAIAMQGKVKAPLFNAVRFNQLGMPIVRNMNNITFIKLYVAKMLAVAFPNLTRQQVGAFVDGLMNVLRKDEHAFATHMHDFLVTMKEFGSEDESSNEDLHVDDQAAVLKRQHQEQSCTNLVPGLIPQYEGPSDDVVEAARNIQKAYLEN